MISRSSALYRRIPSCALASAVFMALSLTSFASDATATDQGRPSEQLSVGYSLLYQEADGIPKLKWILMFKDKSEEMGRLTKELMSYYEQLAKSLEKLATQYPAVHLDATTMPEIEAKTRKAIGTDLAKEMAPVAGKKGKAFERTALLMFDDSLNEQRHLVEQMVELETVPALKTFLQTTKDALDSRHAKVDALLSRQYFTHDK